MGRPVVAALGSYRVARPAKVLGVLSLVILSLLVAVGATGGRAGAQTSNVSIYQWGKLSSTKHYRPRLVANLPSDIVAVQAGNWGGMALDATGHVWDWGHGQFGELGNGHASTSRNIAVEARGVSNVVSIGEGDDYAAAVDKSGHVWVWGDNLYGTLCFGHKSLVLLPRELPGLKAVAVQGGGAHLLILLANGTVDACGLNAYGELGNGSTKSSTDPVAVENLTNVVAISSGNEYSAAMEADGSVWTWGRNTFGQLGNGTMKNEDIPQRVNLPAPATQIYAGGDFGYDGHMLVRLSTGEIMAWGNDKWGQLGNGVSGSSYSTPQAVKVPSGVNISTVAAGGRDSFAIDTTGRLWSWGFNGTGDLGVGNRVGHVVTTFQLVGNGFSLVSATADEAIGASTGP